MRREGGKEDGKGDVEREIEKEYKDVELVEMWEWIWVGGRNMIKIYDDILKNYKVIMLK